MMNIKNHNNYLFVFAHPDDEIYCCNLIENLINAGKRVHTIYVTSGDRAGVGDQREKESLTALASIGVIEKNIYFLRISENDVLNKISDIVSKSVDIARVLEIDCLITHDYEGGHEAHDVVSFSGSEIVRLLSIPNHYVFPLYHGKPQERKGARFNPTRTDFIILPLGKEGKELKKKVLESHSSQKAHFSGLQKSASDYMDLLLTREVFMKIDQPIDFTVKPMSEIGYEFHRNGFKFSDFQNSLDKYKILARKY